MGTQTMGSQAGIGDTSMPKPLGSSRRGSLYSLTLDEVQNQLGNLGKPLGSFNLDELLRTVEATQNLGNGSNVDNGAPSLSQGGLGRQGLNRQSSISLSSDLREKTVEEVWREIQRGKSSSQERNPERQNTLGEMTLEDFLVQAGVVIDAPAAGAGDGGGGSGGGGNSNAAQGNLGDGLDPNAGHPPNVGRHAQWMPYQLIPQQQQHSMMTMYMPAHPVPQPISVSGGALSDTGYSDAQLAVSTSHLMGTLSDPQTFGRKRVAPGDVVEKTVERRQKRMIKNRESAARSRARKQEVEKALPSVPPPQPKYQLRRTSSGPI